MKQQVIYENGYYFYKDTRDQYLWSRKEKAARRRAARRGQVPMTFGQKLRRFSRKLRREINGCIERSIEYMYEVQHGITDEERALCRELDIKPWERVIELGSGRNE